MEWTRGPVIGRGGSATVSVATTPSGEILAVKSTDLSSSSFLQKELSIISQLNSPYVIKCLGSEITLEKNKPVCNLFLEYATGGALSDQIRKLGGSVNESTVQFYAHQIAKGLNYLHLNGVIHGDIKGQNILIGEDGLKIADFGCAKLINGDADVNAGKSRFSGTPAYMAPEVARGEEQGFPADIWAFGCTMIEMATGSSPWPELHDPVSALYRIGYSGDVPEYPRWLSDQAKDFLCKCLIRDPKLRWTAEELLQHSFFCGLSDNCGEMREFTWESPTSILEKGFWDSIDPPEYSSGNPDSPADRIGGLIRDFSSVLNLPSWTEEEEDWITVRVIDFQENLELHETSSNLNQGCDDELYFVVVNANEGDSSSDCFSHDISITYDFEHESINKDFYVSRIHDFYPLIIIINGNSIFITPKLFHLIEIQFSLNNYYMNLVVCIEYTYDFYHRKP